MLGHSALTTSARPVTLKAMRTLMVLLALGSAAAAPATFVKTYSNATQVLQWTEVDGRLTGTFQQVFRTAATPPTLKVTTLPFIGTRRGNTFTFQFTQSALGFTDTKNWTGTLSGSTLSVTVPSERGGLTTTAYTRSSADAYNAAVKTLTAQVTAARTLFEQQDAQRRADAAAVQAQTTAVTRLNSAAADALYDAAQVQAAAERVTAQLTDLRGRLPEDLARVVADHEALLTAARDARSCDEVSQVQGYHLDTLSGYDRDVLTGYVAGVLEDLADDARDAQQEGAGVLTALDRVKAAAPSVSAANPRSQVRVSLTPADLTNAGASLTRALSLLGATLTATQAEYRAALAETDARIAQARTVAAGLDCPP